MSNVDISAVAQIARHAKWNADRTAIVYEDAEIGYGELYDSAGALAAALQADGVGPGDRVAYAGLNSVTFFTTYFATIWIGAAFLPLNFRLPEPEARAVLADSRPDVLVAEPAHARMLHSSLAELSIRRALVVDDDAAIEEPGTLVGWGSLRRFRSRLDAHPAHARLGADDLALLLYTSGTTGSPKGVMLTHGNLWWNWLNVDSVVDTRVDDVNLAVAPLFHIGGLNALTLRTLVRGGTVIIRRTFDPAQALSDLVAHGVTSIFLVPAMLAAIHRQPGFEAADLSALRSAIAAGAPVPPALISQFADKGVLLQQAWGLTETAPFSTYLESAQTSAKLGSCGVVMPYTEVKVVDPADLSTVEAAGASGELWVRGPNVSRGYWNNPEATAQAFTDDGWFRTGDLGYQDDEGYFFIVDRLKDMIISGGENVYPAEVENVLNEHPSIVDIAVIGLPDDRWGETVCAVVAFTEDAEETLDSLRDYLTGRLARYKLPRRLVAVSVVPRNGAGKLDKPAIRAMVAALGPEQVHSLDTAPFTEAVPSADRRR